MIQIDPNFIARNLKSASSYGTMLDEEGEGGGANGNLLIICLRNNALVKFDSLGNKWQGNTCFFFIIDSLPVPVGGPTTLLSKAPLFKHRKV